MRKKKKILLHTDFSLSKSGFGKYSRTLLTYLYKTGKYDLVHYCCGVNYSHPEMLKTPWKSVGCLPDNQQEINQINQNPEQARMAAYGNYYIDKVITEEKPDVYIAAQDIWGVCNGWDKFWWNKIPCVVHTTLDSLPLLPLSVEKAPAIKNYWIWADFATQEFHRLGHKHVKTVRGPLDPNLFYKLPNLKKFEIRKRFNIGLDEFIIGFVFRNQLRKSVPNLLEGYKLFREKNPEIKKCKLLLHSHFSEGWNIMRLTDEYKIPKEDILTAYVCKNCKNYEVKQYTGQDLNCRFCNSEKSQLTTNVAIGVSEEQLNEVYNLMNVYAHPFTSGGQEIPILEAKQAELITLVTNYSCGEDLCVPEAQSFPLEWFEYREHGTEFRKASTNPMSIAKQLKRVYSMSERDREEMGKKAREWTIQNFSIDVIGKMFEDFIDACEKTTYDFLPEKPELKNPDAIIDESLNDDDYIKECYKKILNMVVDDKDSGYCYWAHFLKDGDHKQKREQMIAYFRSVATQENQKNAAPVSSGFDNMLLDNGKKQFLIVCPESAGDCLYVSATLESFRESYPSKDWNLYLATKPEYAELFDGCSFIDKVLPFQEFMNNEIVCIGQGKNKGLFQGWCFPAAGSQRFLNYLSNQNIAL